MNELIYWPIIEVLLPVFTAGLVVYFLTYATAWLAWVVFNRLSRGVGL